MKNFFSTTGFYWWTGVVEDRMDPLFLGRCRIRILGYHTEDKAELPTEDLAWAMPMQPITSAAVTGFGTSPTGPLEGSWVVGFFVDGDDMQQPMFIGTFAGIPQSSFINSLGDRGFQDPNKKYPLRNLLDEPDTDRLARNQGIAETIVAKKREVRDKNVETAMGGASWDQPVIPYGAKYPYNHVTHTESGHIIEVDDTPSGERLHTYHKTGTYTEIHPDGTRVDRIVGSNYEIIDGHGYIHIRGKANVTVEGSVNIYVKNNCNLEVNGDLKMHGHGDVELKAGKDLILTAKENVRVHADKNVDIDASKKINMKSKSGMKIKDTSKTTIGSPVTEVGLIKVNGMGITPLPPSSPTINAPDTIGTASTSEPTIKSPAYTLLPEERLIKIAEIIELEDVNTPQSREYVAKTQEELDTNEAVSADTTAETDPVEKSNACGLAQKVIEAAEKDLNVVETGTKDGFSQNYGGLRGESSPGKETPKGQPGRIDAMHLNAGLENKIPTGTARGEGYPWCASAVTTWWKEAGAPTPPSGPASCKNWATWAKSKGYYSSTPKLGAAIVYGPEGAEHHIGIVTGLNPLTTIEGNTSQRGFNANGCGCFRKKPNTNRTRAYIHLPEDVCPDPIPTPTTEDLEGDIKTFIENLKGKTGLCPESVRLQLPEVAEKFGIDTPLRMSHFLAQIKHESQDFARTEENLYYKAPTLMTTSPFNKYFKSLTKAKEYELNPQKIANLGYSNKLGNGSVESGDGYKYRGRGYIQLTGKVNYASFNKYVSDDVIANPDLVATKYPMMSAGHFWTIQKKLNSIADQGATSAAVEAVTRKVNGGTNGIAQRQTYFNGFIALA